MGDGSSRLLAWWRVGWFAVAGLGSLLLSHLELSTAWLIAFGALCGVLARRGP